MTQVSSYNMQYCANHEDYQLAATGHAKVAVYMAYALGGSVFIGLTRLIAALGALCVDYKAKAMAQEAQNKLDKSRDVMSTLETSFSTAVDEVTHVVEGFASIFDDGARVRTLASGIQMCEKDISSHWQQVARAIVELTVVGGWIYTLIEAARHYHCRARHSVDTLDWGRCEGMLGRITSDFADRQYVPESVIEFLSEHDASGTEEERSSWVQGSRTEQSPEQKVVVYQRLVSVHTIIERLQNNELDWDIQGVREHLLARLNASRGGNLSTSQTQALNNHKFENSTTGWCDMKPA